MGKELAKIKTKKGDVANMGNDEFVIDGNQSSDDAVLSGMETGGYADDDDDGVTYDDVDYDDDDDEEPLSPHAMKNKITIGALDDVQGKDEDILKDDGYADELYVAQKNNGYQPSPQAEPDGDDDDYEYYDEDDEDEDGIYEEYDNVETGGYIE